MVRFKNIIFMVLNTVRNFMFTPKCIFCREIMGLQTQNMLCTECRNKLPYTLAHSRCKKCGKPVAMGEEYCEHCMQYTKDWYTRITASYIYENRVRDAILRFKNERYRMYGDVFAKDMKVMADYDYKNVDFDIIVSVPPRRKRMLKTGYDQAEYLAKALSNETGIKYITGVMKQKDIRRRQSGLSYEERLENVKGNFMVVKKDEIANKTILLVDDVCTTRATFKETSKMLKKAGAFRVYCISAATTA